MCPSDVPCAETWGPSMSVPHQSSAPSARSRGGKAPCNLRDGTHRSCCSHGRRGTPRPPCRRRQDACPCGRSTRPLRAPHRRWRRTGEARAGSCRCCRRTRLRRWSEPRRTHRPQRPPRRRRALRAFDSSHAPAVGAKQRFARKLGVRPHSSGPDHGAFPPNQPSTIPSATTIPTTAITRPTISPFFEPPPPPPPPLAGPAARSVASTLRCR